MCSLKERLGHIYFLFNTSDQQDFILGGEEFVPLDLYGKGGGGKMFIKIYKYLELKYESSIEIGTVDFTFPLFYMGKFLACLAMIRL